MTFALVCASLGQLGHAQQFVPRLDTEYHGRGAAERQSAHSRAKGVFTVVVELAFLSQCPSGTTKQQQLTDMLSLWR